MGALLQEAATSPREASSSWEGQPARISIQRAYTQTVENMVRSSDLFRIIAPGTVGTAFVGQETFKDMLTRVSTSTSAASNISPPELAGRTVRYQEGELRFVAERECSTSARQDIALINKLYPKLHTDPTMIAALQRRLNSGGQFLITTGENQRRYYGLADYDAITAMIRGLVPSIKRSGKLWLELPKDNNDADSISTQTRAVVHTEKFHPGKEINDV